MRQDQWSYGQLRRVTLVGALLLGGCGAVNPYQSEFQCPSLEDGKCISVGAAYDEALGGEPPLLPRLNGPEPAKPDRPCEPCPLWPDCEDEACEPTSGPTTAPCAAEAAPAQLPPAEAYRGAVYRRLAGMVEEPRAPLVTPPQVVRVWLLPYEGEGGELFMERYVYLRVDEPRWVLDADGAAAGDE